MRFLLFLILLSSLSPISAQQTRSDLEKARLEIIKKIEETQQRLTNAEANKESTLSKLNALEKQIDARTALISNLEQDASLSTEVISTETVAQVETASNSSYLMEDYKKLLRIRYRNKLLNKNLSTLYNSERLNELVTKWRYLKTYEARLSTKGSEINKLDSEVKESVVKIEAETTNHAFLIQKEKSARDSLKLLMQSLSLLATKMTTEEKSIKQSLETQNQAREQFNQAIEKIIFGSLNSTSTVPVPFSTNSKKSILDKKGFLPWPMQQAKQITRYGPQPHPTVEGIIVDNKGIDLSAASRTVTTVFEGEVISVASVDGSGVTVIVRHQNDIYSVYANLSDIFVKQGSKVNEGTKLGSAKISTDGQANIHFELYQGKQNLNPNHWLKNN